MGLGEGKAARRARMAWPTLPGTAISALRSWRSRRRRHRYGRRGRTVRIRPACQWHGHRSVRPAPAAGRFPAPPCWPRGYRACPACPATADGWPAARQPAQRHHGGDGAGFDEVAQVLHRIAQCDAATGIDHRLLGRGQRGNGLGDGGLGRCRRRFDAAGHMRRQMAGIGQLHVLGRSISTGPGRPSRAMRNASATTRGRSSTLRTSQLCS